MSVKIKVGLFCPGGVKQHVATPFHYGMEAFTHGQVISYIGCDSSFYFGCDSEGMVWG